MPRTTGELAATCEPARVLEDHFAGEVAVRYDVSLRRVVAQLRAKQGGDAIPVTIGDMTTAPVEGAFAVVYLVCSTIGNVETQDRQVASATPPPTSKLVAASCDRGRRARPEPPRPWPRLRRLRPRPRLRRLRPGRRPRRPARCLPPPRGWRRRFPRGSHSVLLRVAFRARPHGAARRPRAGAQVGRLGPITVHRRQSSHVSVWRKQS